MIHGRAVSAYCCCQCGKHDAWDSQQREQAAARQRALLDLAKQFKNAVAAKKQFGECTHEWNECESDLAAFLAADGSLD